MLRKRPSSVIASPLPKLQQQPVALAAFCRGILSRKADTANAEIVSQLTQLCEYSLQALDADSAVETYKKACSEVRQRLLLLLKELPKFNQRLEAESVGTEEKPFKLRMPEEFQRILQVSATDTGLPMAVRVALTDVHHILEGALEAAKTGDHRFIPDASDAAFGDPGSGIRRSLHAGSHVPAKAANDRADAE